MRPNLSFEKIAGALAVLGTGVIMAACGGEEPKTPVNANEVSGATDKAADGANHCGAGKDHKAGEAACSADKKAGDATPAITPAAATAATPAAATPADAKPADAKPADAKGAAPAATGAGKKPAAPTPAKKGASGSCGAGTCSAKK